MATELAGVAVPMDVTRFKYSNRVVLKTILGSRDGGLVFVGKRVVIGGWVRSSKVGTIEPGTPPLPPPKADEGVAQTGSKDVSCVEILQSRIPFIRSIMKVLGGGNYHPREKLEQVVSRPPPPPPPPPPQPSIALLQVSDGSCVACLQVLQPFSLFCL
jgi:asparaginyl-tRNA synthetase